MDTKISSMIKAADIVTLGSGVFGFLSILASISGNFHLASIYILISAFFDFIDGKIARHFGGATAFGKALDYSDIVPFGVAPAAMACMLYPSILTYALSAIFVACGMLRLARFIVLDKDYFVGMPITVNGLIFPAIYFSIVYLNMPIYSFLIAMLISSALMICNKRFNKIKIR